jgi:hypothetical protein
MKLRTKMTCYQLASEMFEGEEEIQLAQLEYFEKPAPFYSEVFNGISNEKYKLISALCKLTDTAKESANPYNTVKTYLDYRVIADKWATVRTKEPELSPGRIDQGQIPSTVKLLTISIALLGFDPARPVICDNKGRVLDGINKIIACKKLGQSFRYLVYDFDPDVQ